LAKVLGKHHPCENQKSVFRHFNIFGNLVAVSDIFGNLVAVSEVWRKPSKIKVYVFGARMKSNF
jgi:hypothetical protein